MPNTIFINGMGVLGREVFRRAFSAGYTIAGVSDASMSPSQIAYLLSHDTLGTGENNPLSWTKGVVAQATDVDSVDEGKTTGTFLINAKPITCYRCSSVEGANSLPLGEILLECSGSKIFATTDNLQAFINAGAKYVLSVGNENFSDKTAPYFTYGVNEDLFSNDITISYVPPMSTQAVALVLNALQEANGGFYANVTTIRSYSNLQRAQDSFSSVSAQPQLGRAGAYNIVALAHKTDAVTKYVGVVVPALNGKVLTQEYRVPVIDGAIADIIALDLSVSVNETIKSAVQDNTKLKEALLYQDENTLCSSDVLNISDGKAVFDATATTEDNTTAGKGYRMRVLYDEIGGLASQALRMSNYIYTYGG